MISAIVLAAGLSSRMGHPKMILPWRSTTVIGQVVATLARSKVDEIVVVTGSARTEVESAVEQEKSSIARTVFNPRYAEDNMLISLQAGIRSLNEAVNALLVVLGDQPQIEAQVVGALLKMYRKHSHALIVPSYNNHRGHPWLVDRKLWEGLLSSPGDSTMRDFLQTHAQQITYLSVATPSILADIDTPQDYARNRLNSC
jgi:molybdenum cofactor cytidylyltransferase